MFFLARAAVCIGLVAAAASSVEGPGLASALDRGVRGAAEAAGQACLHSVDCLRLGTGVLAAAPLAAARFEDGPDRRAEPATASVPLPPPRPLL